MENRVLADINVLKDAISNRKLVVFAGAGISVDAGVPTWGKLIEALKDEMSIPDNENDYLKIAQMYFNERQEKEYTDKIRSVLGVNNATYTGIHRGIFNLKPEHVITTNYDGLLEQVVRADALPYSIIKNDSDFPFSSGTNLLVKMHGDINGLDMVLKEDDYLEYSNTHPLVESFIKSVFSSKVVLFVGYSFSDINLKMIVQTVRNILGKSFQMAYLFSPSTDIHDSQRQYLKRKGINVISYADGFYDDNISCQRENYFNKYVLEINKENNLYAKESSVLSENGRRLHDFLLFLDNYNPFKDNLLKYGIIEQLDFSLGRFNDVSCLPPSFLGSLYPFRSNEQEVAHNKIDNYILTSANESLNNLFYNDIEIRDGEVLIVNADLDKKHEKAKVLTTIIHKLNNSLVYKIQGKHNGGITDKNRNGVDITLAYEVGRDLPLDNYLSLKLDRCLSRVSTMSVTQTSSVADDLALAYINYKLENSEQCLSMLDAIANKAWQAEKYISYFIAKHNMVTLHNLISHDFDIDDRHKNDLLVKINSIQLDDLVAKLTKLDKDQRAFVMQLKDRTFIRSYEIEIRNGINEIHKVMWLYNSGSGILLGASHHINIEANLNRFFRFFTLNNIIYDEYSEFRSLCQDVLEALIISLSLPVSYKQKATEISRFILLILIHYCDSKKLIEKMKQVKLDSLPIDMHTRMSFVSTVNNFLKSNHVDSGLFNTHYGNRKTDAQLNKLSFNHKYESIFNNSMFVLSYIELDKGDVIELVNNLKTFLLNVKKTQLSKFVTELPRFLMKHYEHFSWADIYELLQATMEWQEKRASNVIYSIYYIAMKKEMTDKIEDITIVNSIINSQDDHQGLNYLVYLWYLSSEINKEIIKKVIINKFKSDFDEYSYYLASDKAHNIISKYDYLDKAIEIATENSPLDVHIADSEVSIKSFEFTDLIRFMYYNDIDPKVLLGKEKQYSLFQMFLIDPSNFDYKEFKPEWLTISLTYDTISKINEIHDLKPYITSFIRINSKNRTYEGLVNKLRVIYFEALV